MKLSINSFRLKRLQLLHPVLNNDAPIVQKNPWHRSKLCRWADDGGYLCRYPQYRVTVVDINPDRIAKWNSDNLPIYEPGLDEIVCSVRGINLFFDTDMEKGIRESDIIFVSVNTPTKTYGLGAGYAADLQYWEKTARQIREYADSPKIIIEKSTLPIKTAQAMKRILKAPGGEERFEVLSNPEFMTDGSAIADLQNPERVLIGSDQTQSGLKARDELVVIYLNWIPRSKILTTNIWIFKR